MHTHTSARPTLAHINIRIPAIEIRIRFRWPDLSSAFNLFRRPELLRSVGPQNRPLAENEWRKDYDNIRHF